MVDLTLDTISHGSFDAKLIGTACVKLRFNNSNLTVVGPAGGSLNLDDYRIAIEPDEGVVLLSFDDLAAIEDIANAAIIAME